MFQIKKYFLTRNLALQISIPLFAFIFVIFASLLIAMTVVFQEDQANSRIVPSQEADRLQGQLEYLLQSAQNSSRLAVKNTDQTSTENHFLQDIIASDPLIVQLQFYDAQGNIKFNIKKPTAGLLPETEPNMQTVSTFQHALMGQEVLERPFLAGELPFVFWFFPVRDVRGQIIGAMRTRIDISVLWNIISRSAQGSAYIVDDKGILLLSENLNETKDQKSLKQLAIVNSFLQNKQGIFTYKGLRDQEVVGSWRKLAPTNWAVIVEVPVTNLFQRAYNLLIFFLALVFVAVSIILFEIFWLNKKVFRPLSLLREGAKSLGEGKLDTKIAIRANNEFDLLAITFNEMAEKIQSFYRDLEQKVEERTVQLKEKVNETERLNKMMINRELKMAELKKEIGTREKELAAHENPA